MTGPRIGGSIDDNAFDPSYPRSRGIKPIILPILATDGVDTNWDVEGCRLVFTYQAFSGLTAKRYVLGIVDTTNLPY